MNADETMKNTLREAMLGPSVLLLALSAISTGSGCQAAPAPPLRSEVPTTTPAVNTVAVEVQAPVAPEAPVAVSPFVVQAKVTQTSPKAGEVLEIVIEIKNTSETQQTLHFATGQKFDVQAFKADETGAVWTWSANRAFTQMIRDQIIEPGASVTYKAKWPSPPEGKFSLRAKVTANGGISAAPIDVVISAAPAPAP